MTDLPSYRHFCIKVKHFLARLPAGPRWEATLDQWQSMQGKKRPRGAPQKYEGGKNTGCAAQTAGSWNQGSGVCDRKIPQPGRQVSVLQIDTIARILQACDWFLQKADDCSLGGAASNAVPARRG